ncbi:hypothetical protein GALMADRAFT_785936 [Galerina marginata CBS 339.88]|uniref:Uncharacterized protein n=1 Tax=Galerina marginata (strain CBS 339.88) TaxID=685588 RepID=A0A067SKD9_GALM3|nr:hypothetical protein GALMADRAFT_785936 [Galerina marginata CBS 339.88]
MGVEPQAEEDGHELEERGMSSPLTSPPSASNDIVDEPGSEVPPPPPPAAAAAASPRAASTEEEASAPATSPQPRSPAAPASDDHLSPNQPAIEIHVVRPSPSPSWALSPLSTAPQSPMLLSPVSGPPIPLPPSTSASKSPTQAGPPSPLSPSSPSSPSSAAQAQAQAAAPTKVKLLLRDFVLRKKKQREEMEVLNGVQALPKSVSSALETEGEGDGDVEVGGGSTGAWAGVDGVLGADGRHGSEEEKEKVGGVGVTVDEGV